MGTKVARILLAVSAAEERLALATLLAPNQITGEPDGVSARARFERERFDLVLFADDLPDLERSGLLEAVGSQAASRWVPRLALCHAQSPAKLLALGADEALSVPFEVAELCARAQAMLRLRERFEQLEQEKAALAELAITDGLTGLYNHRHFTQRLDEEFRRAMRYAQPLSLLMIDLDRFKAVNDTFGHAVGDAALRHASAVLRNELRTTDVLARHGGEEFAGILPQTTRAGADLVARRIGAALEHSPLLVEGAPIRLTASIGVSHAPAPAIDSSEALLAAADGAMYRAKRAGRNRVVLATPEQGAPLTRPGPN